MTKSTAKTKQSQQEANASEKSIIDFSVSVADDENIIEDIKEEKPETIVYNRFNSLGTISIKPLVDNSDPNTLGLNDHGLAIFPSTQQREQITAYESNGIVRYASGLDEFAPEIQEITDQRIKEQKIKDIRIMVSYLERVIGRNHVDVNDENFWDKVKTIHPNNAAFWNTVYVICDNNQRVLEPLKDPMDMILLLAIEAGGFSIVAKSYDDAMALQNPPKFYLEKSLEKVGKQANVKRLKNNALAKLNMVSEKNKKQLLYLVKLCDKSGVDLKYTTPTDVLYDIADDYINGKLSDSSAEFCSKRFLEMASLPFDLLEIKAIVSDSAYYHIIQFKGDNKIYHTKSGIMLGRNVKEVAEYMQNPLNQDIYNSIKTEMLKNWEL